jgi:hypothetical protein
MLMVRASPKKRTTTTKYDFTIKAKLQSIRIIDINNDIVRLELNEKGQAAGKYYSGVHWDTVEATMLADGNATLTIRYLHVTKNGEFINGIGTGTRSAPNKKGIARVTGEGTMWKSAPRLSHLNSGKWAVNGEVNTIKETVEIRGNFTPISNA